MAREVITPIGDLLKYLFISLAITVGGLIIGSMLPINLVYTLGIIFPIVLLVLTLGMVLMKKSGISMTFVYIYSFILGITLYPSMLFYVSYLGASIVLCVFIGTLIFVGLLSLMSFNKGNDNILKLGPILFALTIGLIIVSLLMIFFTKLSGLSLIITIVSIVIFSLWVVYDVYVFKKSMPYIRDTNDLAPHVLNIYVDFINLLLDLLRLLSILKSDD